LDTALRIGFFFRIIGESFETTSVGIFCLVRLVFGVTLERSVLDTIVFSGRFFFKADGKGRLGFVFFFVTFPSLVSVTRVVVAMRMAILYLAISVDFYLISVAISSAKIHLI
jgi:hypothetical protein